MQSLLGSRRFRPDKARREVECFDCRVYIEVGGNFAWDNLRNCKVCSRCFAKLKELLGEAAAEGKLVRWNPDCAVKPWEMGDYDINYWPEYLQQEYVTLSSSPEQYAFGYEAAVMRRKLARSRA